MKKKNSAKKISGTKKAKGTASSEAKAKASSETKSLAFSKNTKPDVSSKKEQGAATFKRNLKIKSSEKLSKATSSKKNSSRPKKEQNSGSTATLVKRVLFRPDRFQYVRQKIKTTGCVFCHAASEPPGFETLCVYKTEHSMIVLNKFPYNSGHLLVVPIHHKGHLLTLSDVEYLDLHSTLKIAVRATESLYQPAALNIGLNHGKAAGAGLPDHLHYHLIPRWEGDLNFFPLIAETKAVVESLEQTFEKFKAYFLENSP